MEELLRLFRARFPEFDTITDTTVSDVFITDADTLLDSSAWGTHYQRAVITLAAHELALSQQRQASAETNAAGQVTVQTPTGALVSATSDGLSVGYTTPATATGDSRSAQLTLTPYGQDYLNLRRLCLSRGRLTNGRESNAA